MQFKVKKLLILLFLMSFGTMLVLTGCGTTKRGCGCGADINRVNKTFKRTYHAKR
jgi:hypothetical protein